MNVEYHRATLADLEQLVESRVEVLKAANDLDVSADMQKVAEHSREYYKKALSDGSHIAYLVSANGSLVGTGGVSFFQVMPTYHNPTGQKAYIMNLYTAPAYRRQGIAWQVLERLVSAALSQGISFISLETTIMGRPLYEKYGFVQMQDEMILSEEALHRV